MKKHILCMAVFWGGFGIWGVSYAELVYSNAAAMGVSKTSVKSVVSGSNGALMLLSYAFRPAAIQSSILTESGSNLVMTVTNTSELTDATKVAMEGKLLNFPNPFPAKTGTTIGYFLSKNMNIELKIFDMMGNLVSSIEKPAGSLGGMQGMNKVSIGSSNFEEMLLSAGVYFYLLIHDGKVLGKGKMAVIPSRT